MQQCTVAIEFAKCEQYVGTDLLGLWLFDVICSIQFLRKARTPQSEGTNFTMCPIMSQVSTLRRWRKAKLQAHCLTSQLMTICQELGLRECHPPCRCNDASCLAACAKPMHLVRHSLHAKKQPVNRKQTLPKRIQEVLQF